MSWGLAPIRTPRQGRKCWSAAQAEPRPPMPAGLVEGAQQSCQESASAERGPPWARGSSSGKWESSPSLTGRPDVECRVLCRWALGLLC